MTLHLRTSWIFDMDGTLTESRHDFPAISRTLGLPAGEPILEALDRLPPAEAAERHQQLAAIEWDIACQATAQPGAFALLKSLQSQGKRLGILTRNTKAIAHQTLVACGLIDFFAPQDILGRRCCAPKPKPDGILQLLSAWAISPEQAVMVGDHKFDLLAGQQARTAVVYFDPSGQFPWQAYATCRVRSLKTLCQLTQAQ